MSGLGKTPLLLLVALLLVLLVLVVLAAGLAAELATLGPAAPLLALALALAFADGLGAAALLLAPLLALFVLALELGLLVVLALAPLAPWLPPGSVTLPLALLLLLAVFASSLVGPRRRLGALLELDPPYSQFGGGTNSSSSHGSAQMACRRAARPP